MIDFKQCLLVVDFQLTVDVVSAGNGFGKQSRTAIILSLVLLAIALIDTYALTPQMSALGMQLNLFDAAEVPTSMNLLHKGYFALEAVKLAIGGTLLTWCYQH